MRSRTAAFFIPTAVLTATAAFLAMATLSAPVPARAAGAASETWAARIGSIRQLNPQRVPSVACARGTDEEKNLPAWPDRPYDVHLPPAYDGGTPRPVVIVLHGGGGSKEDARRQACPNGDLDDPGCLDRLADCEGFLVVYPDGTLGSPLTNARTFNAGGGAGGFACISGESCAQQVDDVRFFGDLLDALETDLGIDPARVYATGFSNGAAMAHRLACELSDRIAAIAPIGAGNQFSAVEACAPARSVPVLEIHGTDDPCWPYAGGENACAGLLSPGLQVPVPETVADWASRNECRSEPVVFNWPDFDPADGTTVTSVSYRDCSDGGDVVLLRVNGGGHAWPGGSGFLPEPIVGRSSQEFSANRALWRFFRAHILPR